MEGVKAPAGWLTILLLACIFASVQLQACTRTDFNSGTQLFINIDESDVNPATQSNLYRAQIPLSGIYQSTVSVALSAQGSSNLDISPNFFFALESGGNTGIYVRLINSLDRDGGIDGNPPPRDSVTYTLTCTPFNSATSTVYTLTIILNDVNDNSPFFRNIPVHESIEELTILGTTVFVVSAADKDDDVNGEVRYSIVSSLTGNSKFAINEITGAVTIFERLDYETQSFYSLTIAARDSGIVPRTSSALLNFTMIDQNDQSAAFVSSNCQTDSRGFCVGARYFSTITSGTSTNGALSLSPYNIRARDKDTIQAKVAFNIFRTSPSGYGGYFSVNPATQISNSLWSAQINQVKAINRNNFASSNGVITITVEAVEQNVIGYSSYAYVDVTVAASNQFDPTISTSSGSLTGYISEAAEPGTNIRIGTGFGNFMKLTVSDADYYTSEQLPNTYSLSTNLPNLFSINSNGVLQLSTVASLDYETATSNPILLQVVVRETNTFNPRSSTITLTVLIEDANDNSPLFAAVTYQKSFLQGTYGFDNFGNTPLELLTVAAFDADTNPQFSQTRYNITSVSGNGGGLFTINPITGQISADGTFIGGTNYTLTVRAFDVDQPNRFSQTSVFVYVAAVRTTAPSFPANTVNIFVSEGTLSGNSVFQGDASYPDGDTLSYNMQQIDQFTQFTQDFSISNSGLVTVRSSNAGQQTMVLDRESRSSYMYRITAGDSAFQSATMTLSITITDINDNTPRFINDPYLFSVNENVQLQVVGTVSATDSDLANTPNSQIFFTLPTSLPFSIKSATGEISTTGALDRETVSQYVFIVRAIDSPTDSRTGTATVTVNVNDVQDQIPLFVETSVNIEVPETASIGTNVVSLTALDADGIPNINYDLSGDTTNAFSVQTFNDIANIQVAGPLDFETRSSYTLQLTTTDGQNSSNAAARANIFITILNINEFSPVLIIPDSTINLVESAPSGTVITDVDATDNDNNVNNLGAGITFEITNIFQSSGSNLFVMLPSDGRICLTGSLLNDPNRPNQYTLTIRATDNDVSPRTDSAMITVNIIRNQGPPIFTSNGNYFNTIDETLSVASSVLTVIALDSDSTTDPVSYRLSFNDIGSFYFVVDASSGEMTVGRSLTTDDALSYSVRIIATDSGGLSATATAQIRVRRNLNTPQWIQTTYQTTINENYPLLSEILVLTATDGDTQAPHNTLSYSISSFNNNTGNYFQISNTGVLTLSNTIVGTSLNTWTFDVIVRDLGLPSSNTNNDRATVTINVNRNEFSPLFFNTTYHAVIQESLPIGSSIILVSAQYQDTNQFNQISFQVIGDDTAPTFFSVTDRTSNTANQIQADVLVISPLSNGNQDIYYVRLLAIDIGSPAKSATAVVIVDIQRNFQSPQWTQTSYSANIVETLSYGVPFEQVTATDSDAQPPHNTVNYALESATYKTNFLSFSALDYFYVDPSTGEISLRQSLLDNDNNLSNYVLTVRAYDLGTPVRESTQRATVTVNVLTNQSPPQFIGTPYGTTIDKDQSTGQSIYTVTATDNDANTANNLFSVVTYQLVGVVSALNYFAVDAGTGVITLTQSVSSDISTSYTLVVQAYDGGIPSLYDTEVVTVSVNRNTQRPVFDQANYETTIRETQALGVAVVTVVARDPDALFDGTHNVEYFVSNSQAAQQYFYLNPNTGEISLKLPLTNDVNFENTEYTMSIFARDFGSPSLQSTQSALVAINVIRNNNVPVFQNTPYARDISQNVASGSSVFRVTATDADTIFFNAISYTLVGDNEALTLFSIDQSGNIRTTSSLFGRSEASYTVRVQASDNGVPAKVAYEVVNLTLSRNENTPTWVTPNSNSNYRATTSVRETVGFSETVYSFQARDLDVAAPYNTLKYAVIGDNPAPLYFSVGATTGVVTIRSALYADTDDSYILRVTLADQAGRSNLNTATLTINVIRNKFTPRFINTPYQVTITGGFSTTQSVYSVTAVDDDPVNTFERITYRVSGDGNAPAFFSVDTNTGSIFLTQAITSNSQVTYNLRITAYDNGIPSLSNSTNVVIRVAAKCGYLKTLVDGKQVTFYPVVVGRREYSSERCYPGPTALATATCIGGYDDGVRWSNIMLNESCGVVPTFNQSESTKALQNISETFITPDNYLDIINDTVTLTDPAVNLTEADVVFTADIISDFLAFSPSNNEQILNDVYDIVNNVLYTQKDYLDSAQQLENAANRIISSMDELTNEIALSSNEPVKIMKEFLAAVVLEQPGIGDLIIGIKLDETDSTTLKQGNISTVSAPTDVPLIGTDTAIYLTRKLTEGARTRLAFQLYSKTELFVVLNNRYKVNSKVVAARLTKGGKHIEALGDEIVTAVFSTLEYDENMVCAYWNYSASEDAGGWENKGCTMDTKDGWVVCKCNHLTNFAVLIDLEAKKISGTNKLVLGIITKVGLGVSIICLAITIITFLVFKHLRRGRGQQVLVNLSVAMMCSAILFLVGIDRSETRTGCIIVAALLHYFILVTFMWMLVEGVLQYLRFVKVLGTYIPNFIKKSMIPAWGFPLIPVIVIFTLDLNLYYGENEYCWLTWEPFLYGFLIPIAVIIFVNLIVFTMVMYNLLCGRKNKGMTSNQSERKMALLHLQAGLSILVILGLTWLFGFLTVDTTRIIFHYFFAIFNAFQGCFIFLLFTFREPQVRKAWKKLCCGAAKYKNTTSNTDSRL